MASNSILVACTTILVLMSVVDGGLISMNWGRNSFQRLVPSMVVDLLLQNNITAARVYTAQEDILKAFVGSGIKLTIGIFKFQITDSLDGARNWVRMKKSYFESANIRNVVLGTNMFKQYINNHTMLDVAVNSLKNLQDAINEAGFGNQIKATFQINEEVLKPNWTKPSEADFKDEIKDVLGRALGILQANQSPLQIDIFPISFAMDNGYGLEFALMDNKITSPVRDTNDLIYTNVITFLYDSYISALKKIGYPLDIKVDIGHIGWPTDGYFGANATMAERFYQSFLPWIKSDKGTPMHNGPIDIFINSLTDENKMPYEFPFTRHWGIYTTYGDPKYKIDLTGQGRDIYPTKAKGIMRMPERWCIFIGNITDPQIVNRNFDEACKHADCTSLASGGSCSQLTFKQNVSYAFNMYFQSKFQDESACVFEGLGRVSTENPSVGRCIFPVEVVKGQQDQVVGGFSDGNSLFHGHMSQNLKMWMIFMLVWAVVWS